MTSYTNLSNVIVDGKVESSYQGLLVGSVKTMPTPEAKYLGIVVLYTGETTADYKAHAFYECVLVDTDYLWSDVSASMDIPDGSISEAKLDSGVTTKLNRTIGNGTITIKQGTATKGTFTVNQTGATTVTLDAPITPDYPVTDVKVNGTTVVANKVASITVPSIPANVSAFANDAGYQNATQVSLTVTTAVSGEATARGDADTALQSQIDALVSKADVVDVVGTYAELTAYSKTLYVNDIVKVLVDSTHTNQRSYYRCTGGSAGAYTWSYIGSEGEFYTKSEVYTKSEINTTVGTINNSITAVSNRVTALENLLNGEY